MHTFMKEKSVYIPEAELRVELTLSTAVLVMCIMTAF